MRMPGCTAACYANPEAEFEAFYSGHYKEILSILCWILRHEDAEEVANDVMLGVWNEPGRGASIESLHEYAIGAATRFLQMQKRSYDIHSAEEPENEGRAYKIPKVRVAAAAPADSGCRDAYTAFIFDEKSFVLTVVDGVVDMLPPGKSQCVAAYAQRH